MQIHRGLLYKNRTLKYLYPSLYFYGEELINRLKKVTKLAIGIGDANIYIEKQGIYILFDTIISNIDYETYRVNIQSLLDWIREQPYYISDYMYGKDYHMIIIEFPKNHNTIFNNFIKGKYSKMYTASQVWDLFKNQTHSDKTTEIAINKKLNDIRNILLRDSLCVEKHLSEINKDFKSKLTLYDFKEPLEADYPIRLSEEIFNYEKIKGDLWN